MDQVKRIQQLYHCKARGDCNGVHVKLHDRHVKQNAEQNKPKEESYQKKGRDATMFLHKTVGDGLLDQLAGGKSHGGPDKDAEDPAIIFLDQKNRQDKRRNQNQDLFCFPQIHFSSFPSASDSL